MKIQIIELIGSSEKYEYKINLVENIQDNLNKIYEKTVRGILLKTLKAEQIEFLKVDKFKNSLNKMLKVNEKMINDVKENGQFPEEILKDLMTINKSYDYFVNGRLDELNNLELNIIKEGLFYIYLSFKND